jgi:hypothetical protein
MEKQLRGMIAEQKTRIAALEKALEEIIDKAGDNAGGNAPLIAAIEKAREVLNG